MNDSMTEGRRTQDAELLQAFVTQGDEGAFAELVRRHRGTVMSVCRRILGNTQDAEDAFQAVFVALAKHASKLAGHPALGAWLHRVACGTALDAVRRRTTREKKEREASTMQEEIGEPSQVTEETGALLHAELNALPERYRRPLILFHIEERSLEETGRQLNVPVNTVSTWLRRGREKLRTRLLRRGVAVSVAGLGAILSAESASAGAADGLVVSTAKIAAIAAGKAAAAAGCGMSANVAAMTKGAMKMIFMAKVKMAAATAAIAGSTILVGMAVAQAVNKNGVPGPAKSIASSPRESQGTFVVQEGHGKDLFYATGVFASPDGTCIATWNGFHRKLRIWDAKQPEVLLFSAEEQVSDLAFSPDGKRFVTLGIQPANAVKVRSWPSCELLRTLPAPGCHMNEARIFFVLDGDHVAANSRGAARVWDLNTGESVKLEVRDPAIDREEAEIEQFERRIGDKRKEISDRLAVDLGPYKFLAPDLRVAWEKRLEEDLNLAFGTNTLRQFRQRAADFRKANFRPSENSIAPAMSGKAVAVVANRFTVADTVRICDARTGKTIRVCERSKPIEVSEKKQTIASLFSDAAGSVIAEARTWNNTLTLWDAATGKEIAHIEGRSIGGKGDCVVLPRENTILFQEYQKGLMSWNWTKGEEPRRIPAPGSAKVYPLDPEAGRLALLAWDGAAWIMDRATGKTTNWPICGKGGSSDSAWLAVAPNGRFLAAASMGCHVALWDLAEARMTKVARFMQPAEGHSWWIRMAFAPNGGQLNLLHSADAGETANTFGAWMLNGAAPQAFVTAKSGGHIQDLELNALLAVYVAPDGQLIPVDMTTRQPLPSVALGFPLTETLGNGWVTLDPCGETAHVFVDRGTNTQSVLVDLRTGKCEAAKPENADILVSSPDKKWRLARRKGEGVELVSATDGTVHGMFSEGGMETDLQFDATGRRFLFLGSNTVAIGEVPREDAGTGAERRAIIVRALPRDLVNGVPGFSFWNQRGWSHRDLRLLPGGKAVAFGQGDGVLLVDVDTGNEVALLRAFPDGGWLISTPDGLFTGSPDMESRLALVKDGKRMSSEELAKCRNPAEIRKRLQRYIPDSRTP